MALNINGTTGISGVDGSVSAPAVTGTDNNTGITFPAADTIKFSTGGVERMAITNSGISGIAAGITMVQVWGLNSNFSGNATPITGWTKYTSGNAGNLGSDMVESSGIFTFPSTGFYMIETQGYHYGAGSNSSTTIYPRFTTDNGSSFGGISRSYTNVPDLSGTWYNTSYNKHFFDVTNVSTHKCRIDTDGNSQNINADGTLVRFIRLADT